MSPTNSGDFPTDLSVEKSVKSTSVPSLVQNYSPDSVSKKQLADKSVNQHSTVSSQTGVTKVIFVFSTGWIFALRYSMTVTGNETCYLIIFLENNHCISSFIKGFRG